MVHRFQAAQENKKVIVIVPCSSWLASIIITNPRSEYASIAINYQDGRLIFEPAQNQYLRYLRT